MKPALISGIIVLAVGGYFGYHNAYVGPQEKLERVEQELKEAHEEQSLRTHVASSLQALEERQRRLAPKPDRSLLLQVADRLAQEAGIEITSISPEPHGEWGDFTRVAVSLEFTATFHELGHFLSGVERAEPSIRIEHLDLSPVRRSEGARVRLLLSTLYARSQVMASEAP